jgi:hypothetical protein
MDALFVSLAVASCFLLAKVLDQYHYTRWLEQQNTQLRQKLWPR